MRIVNSNLALQGSSYSATAVATYRSQEVIGRRAVSGAHGAEVSGDFSGKAYYQNFSAETLAKGMAKTAGGGGTTGSYLGKEYLSKGTLPPDLEADSSGALKDGELTEENGVIVPKANPKVVGPGDRYSSLSSRDRIRMLILEAFMSRITGMTRKFNTYGNHSMGYTQSGQAIVGMENPRLVNTVRSTFAMETVEEENVSFSAQGTVETADGQSLSLNLNFNFTQTRSVSLSVVTDVRERLMDPLVINFSGDLPKFKDDTITFDLDCDGTGDSINMLASGSGYLALDKNGNGKIDDGSELFGPASGDGYSELAEYDEDGNGWIDEADSVFGNLKIWCMDSKGEKHLVALQDRNVGAIYLGFANTEMKLYGESTEAGRLRKSGLVLLENGESRIMQEMDLRI